MKRYILFGILCLAVASETSLIGMKRQRSEDALLTIDLTKVEQKDCELCGEETSEFNPLSCCKYDATCDDCFLTMIKMSLDRKNIDSIQCPNKNCMKLIEEKDIYAITKKYPEIYAKYLDVAAYQCITNDKDIKHCLTPNCTYSFINDDGLKHTFQCPQCMQFYCSDCLEQHAPKMTCAQAAEHRKTNGNISKEESATIKFLQKNTKPCPKCKVAVEKNGGCYYMKCTQCKHEFCWKCLNPHDHSMNHPCGLWEPGAMNQANNNLILQPRREDMQRLQLQQELRELNLQYLQQLARQQQEQQGLDIKQDKELQSLKQKYEQQRQALRRQHVQQDQMLQQRQQELQQQLQQLAPQQFPQEQQPLVQPNFQQQFQQQRQQFQQLQQLALQQQLQLQGVRANNNQQEPLLPHLPILLQIQMPEPPRLPQPYIHPQLLIQMPEFAQRVQRRAQQAQQQLAPQFEQPVQLPPLLQQQPLEQIRQQQEEWQQEQLQEQRNLAQQQLQQRQLQQQQNLAQIQQLQRQLDQLMQQRQNP